MHAPDEPCIAEELLARLVTALVRVGTIPENVILDLANGLDSEAEGETITRADDLHNMAAALRMWAIDAAGPAQSDLMANIRRSRFRIIEPDA